ncbi:MAG TPA: DUF3800 domain-containing protein [Terriglobales bacterium]
MYLGYVDDTGNDEASPVAIMCAVLIDHRLFYQIEDVAGMIIGDLIPEGQMNKFKEFKAADLFHGHEAFEGIPREKRMAAMFSLLHEIRRFQIPVLYSAVDRAQLEAVAASSVIVSLNPVVAAFKMCLLGIQAWLEAQHGIGELGLLICDETEDNFLKANLRSTFRSLRTKRLPPEWKERRLKNIHDELYFSDSRDSIGIQMADLCAWVVQRSIRSEDVPDLLEEISASTNCAKVEPEWSQNPNIFVEYKW